MRKVLWSGSLKHQGASLTAPRPPSCFSNCYAKSPNQGSTVPVVSFANLPMGCTDGGVHSTGQHEAGPQRSWGGGRWGLGREHMPCPARDASDIPQEGLSLVLSISQAKVWQAVQTSVQRCCSKMFAFGQIGVFHKRAISE